MSERLSNHLETLFAISDHVRYVAIYRDGALSYRQCEGLSGASSGDSDQYEELIVNPVLLKAATQRGDIDCGGLEYLVVRYGNFYQFITAISGGHVSICISLDGDPISLASEILSTARTIEHKLS